MLFRAPKMESGVAEVGPDELLDVSGEKGREDHTGMLWSRGPRFVC